MLDGSNAHLEPRTFRDQFGQLRRNEWSEEAIQSRSSRTRRRGRKAMGGEFECLSKLEVAVISQENLIRPVNFFIRRNACAVQAGTHPTDIPPGGHHECEAVTDAEAAM